MGRGGPVLREGACGTAPLPRQPPGSAWLQSEEEYEVSLPLRVPCHPLGTGRRWAARRSLRGQSGVRVLGGGLALGLRRAWGGPLGPVSGPVPLHASLVCFAVRTNAFQKIALLAGPL